MKKCLVTACGAVALVGLASAANASLTIDIRLVSVGGVNVVDPKTYAVQPGDVGKIVKVEAFAIVAGTNGTTTDDGFQSAAGSFKTDLAAAGLLASIANPAIPDSNFAAAGSSVGSVQDLDGDTDADLGFATGNATTAYFNARAAAIIVGTTFKIATFDVILGAIQNTNGVTTLTFVPRAGNTNGLWREDTAAKNYGSPPIISPATLTTAVPEPATLSVLGIGAAALLGRRRK